MQTDKMAFTVEEQEPQKITFDVGNVQYITDTNYNSLKNKPKINGVELIGNKTLEDLGINLSQWEKVDVLPEVGKTNVLYLVPAEKETEKNVHDEYIYTNGKWEIIGSTSIDLTGYVTIEQLAEELKNVSAPIYEIEINTDEIIRDETDERVIVMKDIVKKYLNNEPFILCVKSSTNKYIVVDIHQSGNIYYLRYKKGTSSFGTKFKQFIDGYMSISYNVETETFYYLQRKEYIDFYGVTENYRDKALFTDNTTSYDVTNDYQPTHKKYVDDTIATALEDAKEIKTLSEKFNIWELETGIYKVYVDGVKPVTCQYNKNSTLSIYGGYIFVARRVETLFESNNYIIFDNYNNEIKMGSTRATGSSAGVSNGSMFTISNTILTRNNTTAYNVTNDYQPAHKKYVDEAVANAGGVTEEYVDEAIANIPIPIGFTEIGGVDENGKGIKVNLWQLATGAYKMLNKTSMQVNANSSYTANGDAYVFITQAFSNAITYMIFDTNGKRIINGQTATSNGVGQGNVTVNLDYVLSKYNTTKYDVTGQYYPAHKLYVDTAISTAIGDVNTILATLTTIEEVAE